MIGRADPAFWWDDEVKRFQACMPVRVHVPYTEHCFIQSSQRSLWTVKEAL